MNCRHKNVDYAKLICSDCSALMRYDKRKVMALKCSCGAVAIRVVAPGDCRCRDC